MPMYEYRCRVCGHSTLHKEQLTETPVCHCKEGLLQRVWSFSFNKPMQPHFNSSVGKYVSNDNQFKDELKRKSEEATLRTGVEHNYQPIDIADRESLGVTDEGLDATMRRQTDTGERERKLIL